MNYLFKNEIINYDYIKNKNKQVVLFLHGWGGNKHSFDCLKNILKTDFSLLSITLPTTAQTKESWNMFDFKTCVVNILKNENINEVIIICHSFGFRVATMLNGCVSISKMVVCAGAGPKKNNWFKNLRLKIRKWRLNRSKTNKLFLKIASKDYLALSETNRLTFKNIVNFNTINMLKFDCPILLFWGKYDKETPLWIAKTIKKQNNAELVITKSDHFAYLKESAIFNNCVINFLKL